MYANRKELQHRRARVKLHEADFVRLAWLHSYRQVLNSPWSKPDKQTVIAVAQDWVPILDKVFGQKWCSDLWQIKEVTTSKEQHTGLSSGSMTDMDSLIRETLMPSCLASQRKLELEVGQPPWLQVDDMEVLSFSSEAQGVPVVSSTGDDSQIRSPSMLQRLLTLPSQLLEGDDESMDAAPSVEASTEPADSQSSKGPKSNQKKKEEENEDEEDDEDDDEATPMRVLKTQR
ncbi:uncharacterized protein LOC130247035 [Danio aesculapii]|uniref:uncharacterized protein LOC130247035 n=1 Tax=Danio aesculapii TaxID=1142201 RepID=UPI0024C00E0F|nr:uncharacterized protein LOC130247035 [Danio aesculapii]